MKTFTIRKLIHAIRLNKVPQSFGYMFQGVAENSGGYDWYENNWKDKYELVYEEENTINAPVYAACALGVAAINLAVVSSADWESVRACPRYEDEDVYTEWQRANRIQERIIDLNDNQRLGFDEIADILTEEYKDLLDWEFTAQDWDYTLISKEEAERLTGTHVLTY